MTIKDWIHVKVYGFLIFVKNASKNISKNKGEILIDKCSRELPDDAKKWVTDAKCIWNSKPKMKLLKKKIN